MSQVIKPTNGRIVWFTPGGDFTGSWHDIQQPLPAMVCHVWGDRMVNLLVTDSNGIMWPVTSVDLVQPGDPKVYQARYCEWMPFQKGQAAKTEAAAGMIERVREQLVKNASEPVKPEAWSAACAAAESGLLSAVCGFPNCDCHPRAFTTCIHPNCTCHTAGGSVCPGGLT